MFIIKAIALVFLLMLCVGGVYLYLSHGEIWDHDRERIPGPTEKEKKAMYYVIGMAALGGACAAGLLLMLVGK